MWWTTNHIVGSLMAVGLVLLILAVKAIWDTFTD
jgi:hypothetical protein